MAKFYIQLQDKLLQISRDLTAENISKALGYVPVSPNVTNELSQRVDNITFDSLKDNPFLQDGSGELNIVDEAGNIIAKVNAEGIHSVDFIAGTHKLTDKIDKAYVDEAVKNVKVDLTGYATEEYVNNIDFYNINNNPIVDGEENSLTLVDENGNIGLKVTEDGLHVKDVIADGHTLSQKADKSDIPSLDGYATESYVNTELENYATKEDIKDIASNSTIIELSGKVSTLIGEDTDKSVRTIANEELLAQLLEGNDNFQTLQELAAWIDEHPESAAAMNEAIQKNASDITNTLTTAKSYTDETIADIDFYSIKNNPIVNSEDGTLTFVDESGYIGLKVSEDGLVVKDVVTPEHTLSNKADKSELPTKVSDLTNDSGFITLADIPEVEIPSLDEYVKSEDLPNFDEFAKTEDIPSLDGYAKTSELPNFNEFAKADDIPSLEGYAKEEDIPSLEGYATQQWVNEQSFLKEHQNITHLAEKSELPTKTSDLTNDSGYITDANLDDSIMWVKAEGELGVRLKGTNGTATGNLAISAGDDKTASDGTLFTSEASGDHAVVFGYGNTCAGRTTLAQGLYNTVNGKDSVAFGQRNLVDGDQAFAAGQQNEVTARLGVAIGYKNKATNTDSIAIGYQNTSSGSASVAMGDTCEASGTSSTAMGYKTKAAGAYSTTFGENTQATNEGEVAMGKYNKSTTSTEASEQTLFSFGMGTSDTDRVNAFEIKKNGDVYIGDKLLSDDYVTDDELSQKGFLVGEEISGELDEVETNTYVKYVAQTLTDEQKEQVRNNIGAPSMEQLMAMYQELLGMINNLQNQAPTVATLDKSVLDNTKLA